MTIARLTTIIEALTGSTPDAAKVARIGNNLYALTESPDPRATNAQKAVACVALLRGHIRGLLQSGGESTTRATIDITTTVIAAGEAARNDL